MRRGVEFVVGTPGRVLDHLERGTLHLEELKWFILDEADRMLDMGFNEDVERVVDYAIKSGGEVTSSTRIVPDRIQVLLFSATIPSWVKEVMSKYMHTDRVTVDLVTEKEKASMYSAGAGDVIAKFLPVLDNFERGLADVSDDTDDAFQKGILAIYKQFKTALDGLGVQEIDALGKTFDPNFHNAVMHVDDKDKGEQEIVEVLQKGYTYNDKVIRYAMVKVAN